MPYKVAFIGLGVMGHRMLGNMHKHEAFNLFGGWDPDASAREETKAQYPGLEIADTPDDLIARPETDVVYIASPPASHREHVSKAIAAGKTVFCEKPLGVDVADSRAMVEDVERSGILNAVNFPFARGVAADYIVGELAAGGPGKVMGADLRLHFLSWPRDWQANAAPWLSRRAEGGFTREVVSHYVYLTERLFGKAELLASHAHYPDGPNGEAAETHLLAQLRCGDVPVSIAASVGSTGPDLVEYTVWGSRRSYRIFDWNQLFSTDGGPWERGLAHITDPREEGYRRMLDNFQAQLDGRPHTMASFAQALSVQELIEAMLASVT
ncbi:MAG: Gfo/Idh/MocA family oxidoreductase [Pseudomonadota bacterium]